MKEEPYDPAKVWFLRARSSYEMAQADGKHVFPEDRCYALQQAAEKAIKAIFIMREERFPHTHDISLLLRRLKSSSLYLPPEVQKSVVLTPYATQSRYPGFSSPVTEDEYQKMLVITAYVLKWAEEIIYSR
jgi:HEPN domain-containing protein